jgi:hypothetical protein
MTTAAQMYKKLEDLSKRHERLRKRFVDFFELARYLESGNSSIKGVGFDDHIEDNYFVTNFCGHVFHFCFSMTLGEEGASHGCISCFSVDPFDATKRKLKTEFTYDGTGITDIPKPDDIEDQISLDSDVGAIFLVCHCLLIGMTK